MNLCQLNTFFSYFLASLLHTHSKPAKKWGKSDQLAEVHLYPIYFLQNPYFSAKVSSLGESPIFRLRQLGSLLIMLVET